MQLFLYTFFMVVTEHLLVFLSRPYGSPPMIGTAYVHTTVYMLDGDFTARPEDPSIYLKSRRNDILTQMGGVYTFWTSKISTNNFYFRQIL